MKVVFRADASYEIGTGHIMRCLTLAEALREKGADVAFIARELPGNLCNFIESKNFMVHRLPYLNDKELINTSTEQTLNHSSWLGVSKETDAEQSKCILEQLGQPIDWLVVDHYALDKQWELQLRPYAKKIMVIDDLADRPHDCDLLLDQNLYQNMQTRYDGLVPHNCIKMLGPQYALLRPEFIEARKNLRKRDGIVRRILVFFGGSDPTNETSKALEAIRLLNRPDISVDVVVGSNNPNKDKIKEMCLEMPNTSFYCQIDNMVQLMSKADLAIGAGGSATWERCCLGLPTITVIAAKNQYETTTAVAELGAMYNLGWRNNVTAELLSLILKQFIFNPYLIKKMEKEALHLMSDYLAVTNVLLEKLFLEGNNVFERL